MTRCRLVGLVLACGILFTCVSAEAQEPRQDRRFGLTVGYPSSGGVIGLVWQTSDRTAFRPEFSLSSRFGGDNASGNATSVGLNLTVLRYVARKDGVNAYVGPRISYSRATQHSGAYESTNSAYGVGATVGLQYELTRRISVYGEVGAGYAYLRVTSSPTTNPTVTSNQISSRSSVGLNLFF
jgi:opacity protein-like surface antigen